MKLRLLIFFLVIGICGGDEKLGKLAATDKQYVINLDRQQTREINCLKKLDAIINSKWTGKEKKIPIEDLGEISERGSWPPGQKPSANPWYRIELEEWLMANDSLSSQKISTCMREMIKDIIPFLSQSDIKCLNNLFESHIVEEQRIEKEFSELLKNSVREQLPFRLFVNFHEFVEMMFQNRNPDALSGIERGVYEHLESYLRTEEDKERRVFVIRQDCSWEMARALREAPNSKKKYEEFSSQVRSSLNWRLSNMLLDNANSGALNMTVIEERHEDWLQSLESIETRLTKEVERLRSEQRDAQFLCEYASELAYELFQEQSEILGSVHLPEMLLQISKTASRMRSVEKVLKNRNDIRHDSMHALRTNVDSDTLCLESFFRLVDNHQRLAVVSAFTDTPYLIQDIRCGRGQRRSNGIENMFCICCGSFSVTRSLASLRTDHYEMLQEEGGVYRIVPSPRLVGILGREREFNKKGSSVTTV